MKSQSQLCKAKKKNVSGRGSDEFPGEHSGEGKSEQRGCQREGGSGRVALESPTGH